MKVLQESIPVYKACFFFFLRTEEDLESAFFSSG